MGKNGAKLLVECLKKQGVEYIFGIPGAKIDAVFDALLDGGPKLIVCRHEQNAAFMAGCYGRLTGKPGVVLVTSGPGVSNLATGLLTATTEGDPIVAIGGNVPLSMKFKESHQNSNSVKIMEACTKFSEEISAVEAIPEVVANAFRIATAPQAGASFISFPQDISLKETELEALEPHLSAEYGTAPEQWLHQAAELINKAKLPVLLLGMEASKPRNAKAIRELLAKTPIATTETYQAAGVVSRELFHCFVGRVGLFKNQPGDVLLDAADLIVTIGFNPVEYDPEIWNAKGNKKIIHLNCHRNNVRRTYFPDLEIVGDVAGNLSSIAKKLMTRKTLHNVGLVNKLHKELVATIESGKNKTGKPIHPLKFINELRNYLDDDDTVISDVGSHYMWLARYFSSYQPHHLLFSNGQQTLGVALPWAMAASLVRPEKKIIAISGDGGFLFSAMELETAVRLQSNFVQFIWCDGAYNMVLEQEKLKYNRISGVNFNNPDLVKFAESFGARGFLLENPNDIIPMLKEAQSIKGPVLIQVPIDYSDNLAMFRTCRCHVGH